MEYLKITVSAFSLCGMTNLTEDIDMKPQINRKPFTGNSGVLLHIQHTCAIEQDGLNIVNKVWRGKIKDSTKVS